MNFHKSRIQVSTGPRKHMPRSDPQLPRSLWERFKQDFPESLIFTPFFSDVRHIMLLEGPSARLTSAIPVHLSQVVQLYSPSGPRPECTDRDLSYLHLAVVQGDLPLAHESLRLGTSVHCTEKNGYSPLFYGLEILLHYMRDGKITLSIAGVPSQVEATLQQEAEKHVARICQVCLFLISHHSDPNESHKVDISVFSLACIIGSWDLIRALLLHGATPDMRFVIKCFKSEADKTRFKSLVSELSTAIRPPRICPCGSQRPLQDCHATRQPYPAHYICPCGSRKIHSACCARKTELSWNEKWNEEKNWLDFGGEVRKLAGAVDPVADDCGDLMLLAKFAAAMGTTMGVNIGEPLTPKNFPWLDKVDLPILEVLVKTKRVDPAFAAACKKTNLIPSPITVRTIPKVKWIAIKKTWNEEVDAYIASGVDRRAPAIIEAAAKIGLAGGPLHCKCEASGCGNTESDSVKAFPRCSGCNKAVYCSHDCQKSAWKAHKSACRAGNVQAQILPSQEEYAAEVGRITGFRFA
ncbi:hypothetical protein C8R44DRAFT_983126 [Mycena epipterygia]|nr:hypothetical protein C8R44DRAFT_983126 [Mycena epipterygia]